MNLQNIPIIIEETNGISRINEPLSIGIPLPRGFIYDISKMELRNSENQMIPLQALPLAFWVDKSLKWILLDFQTSIQANKTTHYYIHSQDTTELTNNHPTISIIKNKDSIVVNTGPAKFFLTTKFFKIFEKVEVDGKDILKESKIVLTDDLGRKYEPEINRAFVETEGSLRTTIKIEGCVNDSKGSVLANVFLRVSFFAGSGVVRLDYTIHNPREAKHPSGFWDLGDKGSIYFKDLSLHIAMASDKDLTIEWSTQLGEKFSKAERKKIEIYQDSSGGPNWNSPNHINRFRQMTNSFCGYRVYIGEEIVKEGDRASPVVSLSDKNKRISGAIKEFWQNFPKAIEVENNNIIFRLFPYQYRDVSELQGGEQKTHTIFVSFENKADTLYSLSWVYNPLIPKLYPEWYSGSKVFSYFVPQNQDNNVEYINLVESAIKGENTFFDRRELIDEYGWRNFGDLYADHETVYYKGPKPLISHYNNQYDVVYGALLQFLRSGDSRWFEITDSLARHVIDIDIYHTNRDKSAYNGGLFWHTMHYTNVATATHRCYTKEVLKDKKAISRTGGGSSNEHNYTSGLLLYYYLTGNQQAKEAVLSLAEWVMNMEDGSKTIFRILDKSDTGLSSSTTDFNYHGPGRGAGNSINALIDAYLLSNDRRYLLQAEKLIRRCIHPKDDISKINLQEPEKRWSYTVFLQVLGKYLDTKEELNERDYMFCYAKESLLHYAKWMLDNEYIYLEKREKLEYPTETWAAQEMRKTNVFLFAAKYSDEPLRNNFLEKARFFYDASIKKLLSYETKFFLRPIAILLFCGSMYSYFQKNPEERANTISQNYNFGSPKKFISQRVKATRKFTATFSLFLVILIGYILIILFSKYTAYH